MLVRFKNILIHLLIATTLSSPISAMENDSSPLLTGHSHITENNILEAIEKAVNDKDADKKNKNHLFPKHLFDLIRDEEIFFLRDWATDEIGSPLYYYKNELQKAQPNVLILAFLLNLGAPVNEDMIKLANKYCVQETLQIILSNLNKTLNEIQNEAIYVYKRTSSREINFYKVALSNGKTDLAKKFQLALPKKRCPIL